jgi:hypothetical protein
VKGCRILQSSILRSIYGQVRAGDVSAAPYQQCAFTLVAGAQFARQTKKILAAIEVTSRYQHKARIFAREFVEICQEVRLRGRALSGLPDQQRNNRDADNSESARTAQYCANS